jgi:hypothetical protein
MPPAGFEHAIPASEQQQTLAFYRSAAEIGKTGAENIALTGI